MSTVVLDDPPCGTTNTSYTTTSPYTSSDWISYHAAVPAVLPVIVDFQYAMQHVTHFKFKE